MFENIIAGNEGSGPKVILCSVHSSVDGADLQFVVVSGFVIAALVFISAWQPNINCKRSNWLIQGQSFTK